MRKVTKQTVQAFIEGRSKSVGNTESHGHKLTLHGNDIAIRLPDGTIQVTLAGWGTPTTRERLNGITEYLGLGRCFHQQNHTQMFNGKPIGVRDWLTLKAD